MKRGVNQKSTPMGAIRIISGQWRGRKLPVMNADGLRPTTDRTKETLFNWLLGDVQQARCLDMFAGSGGLGFEALSRNAQSVVFCEQHPQAVKILQDNCQRLNIEAHQVEVKAGNTMQLCGTLTGTFDLIFIDPPFHHQLVDSSIEVLLNNNLVTSGTLIYIEHEKGAVTNQIPIHWQRVKHKQTAQVDYSLYRASQ